MSDAFLALKEWAKNGPADDFWFWTIGLLIAAIVGFFFAFSFIHRKRIIEDTPTSKIRSAAQGYLELDGHGQLMDGQPIVSPLTGTTCTWYEFKVEEQRQTGKRTEWKTIRKGISDELFLIKDETGQCIIDPEDAHVTVSSKDVWYGNEASPVRGPLSANKKHHFFSGIGVKRQYRYTEKLLHSGESLYAIGLYKTVGGAGASFDVNEDVRELIREWKTDADALMKKFDNNADGEIDLQEWQKVRDEAYKQVMEKHSEQKTLPPVHIMNKTNDKRRPFILSALPQDDLIRRLHIYSILSISLFLICGSFSTWLISLRLAS
jgi:E3 ubiquitin ligase